MVSVNAFLGPQEPFEIQRVFELVAPQLDRWRQESRLSNTGLYVGKDIDFVIDHAPRPVHQTVSNNIEFGIIKLASNATQITEWTPIDVYHPNQLTTITSLYIAVIATQRTSIALNIHI